MAFIQASLLVDAQCGYSTPVVKNVGVVFDSVSGLVWPAVGCRTEGMLPERRKNV